MKVDLINGTYDWNEMSLLEFLDEGNVPTGWNDFFERSVVREELEKISAHLKEKTVLQIYPMMEHVFRAFIHPDDIRVVVYSQDPYHNGSEPTNGSAVGLCFSVKPGNDINPSLKNMYKELRSEGYEPSHVDGTLYHWRDQGCALLNTALTVEERRPNCHSKIWKNFTQLVVEYIVERCDGVVWLLMGNHAQSHADAVRKNKTHRIVVSSHPSPLGASKATKNSPAFFGSNVFRDVNEFLSDPIVW